VTVIDRENHHCFQPLLYQVATAALSPADIAWPIRHILRPQRNATVLMEEVRGVDAERKCVQTQFGEIPYDYLVIATGSTHSYFGHDEWSRFAPGLKRIEDGTRIRRSILIAFERAEVMTDEDQRRRLLTFVIVGGGATGVEMAGAIADVARQTLAADFRRIDPRSARIILIEAGPRLLPTFPPGLSDYALKTSRSGQKHLSRSAMRMGSISRTAVSMPVPSSGQPESRLLPRCAGSMPKGTVRGASKSILIFRCRDTLRSSLSAIRLQ
jgi:NADH dehydrogenase